MAREYAAPWSGLIVSSQGRSRTGSGAVKDAASTSLATPLAERVAEVHLPPDIGVGNVQPTPQNQSTGLFASVRNPPYTARTVIRYV
jgi:hypothetical protein